MTENQSIWFARLMMGLPPRPNTDDAINFRNSFPELVNDHVEFCNRLAMLRRTSIIDWFDFINIERFLRDWTSEESKSKDKEYNNKEVSNKPCPAKSCPLKSGTFDANSNDEDIEPKPLELVLGPLGHSNSENHSDYVAIIMAKIRKQCEKEKVTLQGCQAYFIDPYLFTALKKDTSNSFSENFLKELNSSIDNKIIFRSASHEKNKKYRTSDEEIESLKVRTSLNLLKMPDDLFHDRFLILKSNDIYLGVLIGASVNGLSKNKHYIISGLDSDDSKKLWEIISTN